ncbi:type I pullulanase [Mycoplasmatota bacterium]|nr:type I pullulanase [Mycoplasmatota bacterium]
MIDTKKFETEEFNHQYYYSGNDLGYVYTKDTTSFRVWSPFAIKVSLFLYDKGYKSKPYDKIKMNKDMNGTWYIDIKEDLHGVFYTYGIEFQDEKYETVDIYAKACGVNGERGMVVDLEKTNPDGFSEDVRPKLINTTDSIIYEAHIRDLTIHKTANVQNPGKFLGLAQHNTRSPEALTTGLDHLIELGITHIHLLPVFDFGSIDEAKLDKPQYNWGYDPVNYNCLEGSYSTNPIDGEARIREFKTLVQELHRSNIRVVMDVVYNHTYFQKNSNFHKTFPHYYHRQTENNEFAEGSGCGNEVASERLMVRKFIIDSVTYLAKEYHIDGFRFDLMGLHDIQTMNEIRLALDKIDSTILIYGEGWTAGETPLPVNKRALKENMSKMPRIAAFNDDCRDGIKGDVFYAKQPGFVNGGIGLEESVKFAIVGATDHPQINFDRVIYSKKPWATQPNQTINYVSCHDNLCLFDKIVETTEGLDMTTRIKMAKMANTIVLMSQGIPFFLSGEEMLRTKNGDENSYKSPDMINQIIWHSKYDHIDLFEYYRGLIELRKAHPAFRMTTTEMIQKHLRFLDTPVTNTIAYNITDSANHDTYADIVVIFNANITEVKFKLPHFGVWNIIVDNNKAGTEVLKKITGDEIVVPELTSLVLYSNEKHVNEVTVVGQEKTDLKKYAGYAIGAIGLIMFLRRRKKKRK